VNKEERGRKILYDNQAIIHIGVCYCMLQNVWGKSTMCLESQWAYTAIRCRKNSEHINT